MYVTLTRPYLNDKKKPFMLVCLTYRATVFKFAQKQLKFVKDLDEK